MELCSKNCNFKGMTKNYPYFTVFHILISSPIVSLIPVLNDLNLISAEFSALVRLNSYNEDLPKTYNSLWFAIYCVILQAFYLYCSNPFSLILKSILAKKMTFWLE